MLRVMLVDDEPMALEGLQLLIDWRQSGFEIAASCRSGEEALQRIPDAQPDLIVTDLFMPQIDGITLIRLAKERGFAGEFIIVSGYSDFEKARQALSLGVAGYIQKPIDSDEAAGAIRSVRKALLLNQSGNGLDGGAPGYPPHLTAMLLEQPYDASALPRSGEWRLTTWGSPLPIATVEQLQAAARESGANAVACILDEREWLVLYAATSTAQALRTLREQVNALGRTLHAGDALREPEQLLASKQALTDKLNDYHGQLAQAIAKLEQTVTLRQEQAFLAQAAALQGFCEERGRRAGERALAMWRACCARQFEASPDKLARFISESVNTSDIRALGQMTIRLLSPDPKRLSDVVMHHAKAHYAENLTLDSLASSLGYHPAYLGRVFREETGAAFRAWLTGYRMRKAAEMLKSTQSPINDIAAAVGFQKYKSFLDNFKLAYHTTPDAYRRGDQPPYAENDYTRAE